MNRNFLQVTVMIIYEQLKLFLDQISLGTFIVGSTHEPPYIPPRSEIFFIEIS